MGETEEKDKQERKDSKKDLARKDSKKEPEQDLSKEDKKELKQKQKEAEKYEKKRKQAEDNAAKELEKKLKKYPDLKLLASGTPDPKFWEMQDVQSLTVRIKNANLKIEDENLKDLLVGDLEDWAEHQYNLQVDPENPLRIQFLKDPEDDAPLNINWPLGLCTKDGWKLEAKAEVAPRGFINEETEARLEREAARAKQHEEIALLEEDLVQYRKPERPETELRAAYFGEAAYQCPTFCSFCKIEDTDDFKCKIGGCQLAFRIRKWFVDTHFCGPYNCYLFHYCRREEVAMREAYKLSMIKYEEDRKLFLEGKLLDVDGNPIELQKPKELVIPENWLEKTDCDLDLSCMDNCPLGTKCGRCCAGCIDKLWWGNRIKNFMLGTWNHRLSFPHVTLFGLLDIATDVAYLVTLWGCDALLFYSLWVWFTDQGETAIYTYAAIWGLFVFALFFTMCWYFYTDKKIEFEDWMVSRKERKIREKEEAEELLKQTTREAEGLLQEEFKNVRF